MKIRHVLLSMGSSDSALLRQRVQVRGRLLDNGVTDKALQLAFGELAGDGVLAMWWESDDRAFEAAVTSVQAYGLERVVSSDLLRQIFAAPSTSSEHAPNIARITEPPPLPFASPLTNPIAPTARVGLGATNPSPTFSRVSPALPSPAPRPPPSGSVPSPPVRIGATAHRAPRQSSPSAQPHPGNAQPSVHPSWRRFAIGAALLSAALLLVVGVAQLVEVGTVTEAAGGFRARPNLRRASASCPPSPSTKPNAHAAPASALPRTNDSEVPTPPDVGEAAEPSNPPVRQTTEPPPSEGTGTRMKVADQAPEPPAAPTATAAPTAPAGPAAAPAAPELAAAPKTTLTKDEVRGTIARYGSRIARCKTAETAGTTVKVSFSIDPPGSVSGASSADGGEAGACVARVVAGMKFTAFQGSTIPITFPFKL